MRMIKNIGSLVGRRDDGPPKTREVRVDNLRERFAAVNRGPAPLTADDLAAGIAAGELFLEYQPKLDWRHGRVSGAEALVRWHHPEHGNVTPDRFIPFTADPAISRNLTDWVIARAAAQAAQWRADGLTLEVSVNVSEKDVEAADLPDRVERQCQNAGLDPAFLTLELPEPAPGCGSVQITDLVTRLHLQGVRLAIEDFGRCYASLVQMQKVPFAEIRIDLSFVKQMTTDDDCRAIVEALIEVAHELGLPSVAEGVEDDDILTALIELGCDRVQGNYISLPIAGEKMAAFVRDFESHAIDEGRLTDAEIAAHGAGDGGGAGDAPDEADVAAPPEMPQMCAAGGFAR